MKEALKKILLEAGDIMLSAKNIDDVVSEKDGNANFVTKYDVKVQHFLALTLTELYPGSVFIGEEEDCTGDALQGEAWIVDPIDGTTNFIKGLDTSAISVAYLHNGKVMVSAIYNPYRKEFFYAQRGFGATKNDVPIHMTAAGLANNLVFFGTSPYYTELRDKTFDLAKTILTKAGDLRRSGSAVIDFCNLAQGAAAFMFELRLSPWDFAASSLIIEEAGGVIAQLDGSPIRFDAPCSIGAGTPQAWKDFQELHWQM